MESASRRRTDRVSLTIFLEASGKDSSGKEFKDLAETLLINRSGAVILFGGVLAPGQVIRLQRKSPSESHRGADVRVVGQFGRQQDRFLYGVEIVDPKADLWGIEFPAIPESSEAVARMLLECSYCRGREVVHLNELELRAFETNRGVARFCATCGVPSIWTQAAHEEAKPSRASRSRRVAEGEPSTPASGEQRGRRRMRLKTRLTACIREPGSDDELAVCEDISPVGICFRSKRRYPADAPVDVAVPYSPDAANIFLPARIIYSEEIPKSGLFRHGSEYRKPVAGTE